MFCYGLLEIWSWSCIIPLGYSFLNCNMPCVNLIYLDPVTYTLVLTHLKMYLKCFLYYVTLTKMDLVVAEIQSVNFRAETQTRG